MAVDRPDRTREVVGVLYLAAAALAAVAFYLPAASGRIGEWLRHTGLGLVGVAGFAIPVILLYMAVDYLVERESAVSRSRFGPVTLLILMAAALLHELTMTRPEAAAAFRTLCTIPRPGDGTAGTLVSAVKAMETLWSLGIDPSRLQVPGTLLPGGLVGGLVSLAFHDLAGPVGSPILLGAVALVQVVLVFDISISSALTKTRNRVDQAIRQGVATLREGAARRGGFDMLVGNQPLPDKPADGGKRRGRPGAETAAAVRESPAARSGEEPQAKGKPSMEVPSFLKVFFRDAENGGQAAAPEAAEGEAGGNPGMESRGTAPIPVESHEDYASDAPVDLPASGPSIRPARLSPTFSAPSGPSQAQEPGSRAEAAPARKPADVPSRPARPYVHPPIELLANEPPRNLRAAAYTYESLGRKLEETLASFGLAARVVNITAGPVITRFELTPGPGVKVSRIVSLADDIALNLAALGVRIEAPIPGKSAIGIEIPNKETGTVMLRRLIESPEFQAQKSPLSVCLGRDIPGAPLVADLARMPHLLIAGATGSGKSVCLNAMLLCILFKATPDEVRMILIDPKVVELSAYNGIPHLLAPVVTDPKKASNTLNWCVLEMTKRYALFAERGVRDLSAFNAQAATDGYERLPLILIVIDELSDLMATAPTEVEDSIARLTAMARAAGMHLVIATQRPSVDVITGVIKANIPSRVAFAVSSQVDSRTILDMAGAEKLLGKGDMLVFPIGSAKPVRAQGAFVSDKEVERVTEFLKAQNMAGYDADTAEAMIAASQTSSTEDTEDADELLPQALSIVVETGYASVSLLQRRMSLGYPRAARLVDRLHEKGFVGPFEGSKPRKVLISRQQYLELKAREGG